jgi:hypothetical protein
MSLIQLIIGLAVVGVILWLINTMIPMSPAIKKLINIIVVIVAVVYVLQFFGIFTFGPKLWVLG